MAAYLSGSTVNVTIDGQPLRFTGAYMTEDFLRCLGVAPARGRDFTAADNQPGAEKVALISHQVWQNNFGGNPDVIGRAFRVNGKPATVIGVMPQGFNFPQNEQFWIPLYSEFPVQPRADARAIAPAVLAILRPGVTLDQANVELTGIARRFAEAYPDTNKTFATAQVQSLKEAFTPRQLSGLLLTMLGFCVGMLLIACVNVMNMQFARATLRGKELAVRSSLGATRLRLIRQMLTESLLVAGLGAVVGVAAAFWLVDLLSATVRNFDNPPPSWITFDIDFPVLAFTLAATLLAAVVSGFIPAWMSSRANAAEALKEGGRGNTSRTINLITRGLVVFQIVVTCILLIGSLLQVRSIVAQQNIDYGYDTAGLMSARMGLMDGDYPTNESRRLFYDRLVRELGHHPEFEVAALTNRFRMVFSGNGPIEIEGRAYAENRDRPNANFESVTRDFFSLTGQRLVEGRAFNDDDLDQRLPVAVVNAAFARKHFGQESALGRRFRTVGNNGTQFGPWRTIVGVATTIRMLGPFNNPNVDDSGFYVPFLASVFGPTPEAAPAPQFATIVVKPRGGIPAATLANALRREVAKVDPNLPLYFVDTPARNLEGFVAQNRVIVVMFTLFGVAAVVLASIGLYGVTNFSVNQRTQEFGVRMALGADTRRILAMVLRQSAHQLALGLAIGLGLALLVATLAAGPIQNVLFGVTPRDPFTYAAVALLLAAVSFVAAFVPARRATRVDPMIALRAE
jgi:predicted permease